LKNLGKHLIIDLWGIDFRTLDSETFLRKILEKAVKKCKAELLGIQTRKFEPQGVSGIAVIAESHISLHTWPEFGYIAIDIFTCGEKVDPYKALYVFMDDLKPKNSSISEIKRGVLVE